MKCVVKGRPRQIVHGRIDDNDWSRMTSFYMDNTGDEQARVGDQETGRAPVSSCTPDDLRSDRPLRHTRQPVAELHSRRQHRALHPGPGDKSHGHLPANAFVNSAKT